MTTGEMGEAGGCAGSVGGCLAGAWTPVPELDPYVRIQNAMFWFAEFLQAMCGPRYRLAHAVLNHDHMLAALGEP